MKGQFFLISSLMIILFLAILKTNLSLVDVIKKKNYMENYFFQEQFENLKREIMKVVQISFDSSPQEISNNLKNFTIFSRKTFFENGIETNGIALRAFYPKLNSSQETNLTVVFLNFLGRKISFLNLSFSETYKSFYNLKNLEEVEANFSFVTSTDKNYTLEVSYSTPLEEENEKIQIEAEIGKSKFYIFFDLSFLTERRKVEDKIFEEFELEY